MDHRYSTTHTAGQHSQVGASDTEYTADQVAAVAGQSGALGGMSRGEGHYNMRRRATTQLLAKSADIQSKAWLEKGKREQGRRMARLQASCVFSKDNMD